jgi:hypothetical protein
LKKAVFGVYNVEQSESVNSVSEFIEQSCGVKPVSCFQVKTRDNDSLAFRVCIDSQIADKFLNPEIWASGIVIKPWRFKPKVPVDLMGPSDGRGADQGATADMEGESQGDDIQDGGQ